MLPTSLRSIERVLYGCVDASRSLPASQQPGWPACGEEPIRVMLLGTHHMANPGRDVVNVSGDTVLAERRQAELAAVVEQLATWEPDRVAVELPHDWQAAVETVYETYRTGERAYERAESFPDPFPEDFAQNEAVQVGFRLADVCDHEAPLAIDHEPFTPAFTTAAAMASVLADRPESAERDYYIPAPQTIAERTESRLEESSIGAFYWWLNRGETLRVNHSMLYSSALEAEDSAAGIGMLVAWYERNLRTVRTLWDRVTAADRRVLVVFGSGHVRVLRHVLDEAPMFCPVSPLPVLDTFDESPP